MLNVELVGMRFESSCVLYGTRFDEAEGLQILTQHYVYTDTYNSSCLSRILRTRGSSFKLNLVRGRSKSVSVEDVILALLDVGLIGT